MKIKRYTRIYRKRKPLENPVFWIAVAAAMGILVAGYLLFGDPIKTNLQNSFASPSSGASGSAAGESEVPGSERSASSSPSASSASRTDSGSVEAFRLDRMVLVEMSAEVALSGDYTAFLEAARALGANACAVELKAADGVIYFDTETRTAITAGVVADETVDVPALLSALTEAGLTPIAKLSAFRDALSYPGGFSIMYQPDPNVLWLDESKENGGVPWINPYQESGQAYILDLSREALELGFGHLMLDAVQFPDTQVGTQFAYYGTRQATVPRAEVLKEFVEKAKALTGEYGAGLILAVGGQAAISGDDAVYGGNPLSFGADACVVDVTPASLGTGVQIGGSIYGNIAGQTERYYPAAIAEIRTQFPHIQLTLTVDADAANRPALLAALEAAGIRSVMLRSEGLK